MNSDNPNFRTAEEWEGRYNAVSLKMLVYKHQNQALRKIIDELMHICEGVEADKGLFSDESEKISWAKSELEKLNSTGGEGKNV